MSSIRIKTKKPQKMKIPPDFLVGGISIDRITCMYYNIMGENTTWRNL